MADILKMLHAAELLGLFFQFLIAEKRRINVAILQPKNAEILFTRVL